MAHPCCFCGSECYCNGDIDDAIVSKTPRKCESCGCEDDNHDDYDYDDDDENNVPEYYECLGCGWTGTENPGTNCPRCTGASIEEIY